MFLNYLKITLRNLAKHKGYAIINLTGLSLGLAAGILILLYVMDELSFDKFHAKRDRIYRVETAFHALGAASEGSDESNGWPVGRVLQKDYPEVEEVLYSRSAHSLMINFENKRFREETYCMSPEFFKIFSFPLLEGNEATALNEPYSIVITKSMEKKYFHGEPALNKTLVMEDTMNFVVTGVMADMPSNSHIQTSILISFATYKLLNPRFTDSDGAENGWGNINIHNYILLKENTDAKAFAEKAKSIYMSHAGEMMKQWGVEAEVKLQPLNSLYLTSKAGNSMGPIGSIDRVYLVSGIALFVILLACINFINLATARSVYRAKEVGLRKVVGSTRTAIVVQYLSESFWLTMFSLFIALLFSAISLPMFNDLLGKHYTFSSFLQVPVIASIVLLVAVITLLAGYYPALVLSALKPAEILKGKLQNSVKGVQLRRVLVVFQFVIAVTLVSGTFVVVDQLRYMQKENLGFAKDEIFVINTARVNATEPHAFENFRDALASQSMVGVASLNNSIPGRQGWNGQVAYPEGHSGDRAVSVDYLAVDQHYVNMLGLNIIAGRNFDMQRETDLKDGLVLNETAVKKMGWDSPESAIGKIISSPSGFPAGTVIGVVKNYHEVGLQREIGPIVMDYNPTYGNLIAIRYTAANTQEMIRGVEAMWKKQFPGYDFNYFFLNDDFEKQYESEQRLSNVFTIFSVITIIIAVIGLFGLVSFMTVSRTREIGIRKVLGASAQSITRLLSTEFILLVIAANAIALPLAWYFAGQWLKSFATRIPLTAMSFVVPGVLALVIAFVTVSVQTVRAALDNPVASLRE